LTYSSQNKFHHTTDNVDSQHHMHSFGLTDWRRRSVCDAGPLHVANVLCAVSVAQIRPYEEMPAGRQSVPGFHLRNHFILLLLLLWYHSRFQALTAFTLPRHPARITSAFLIYGFSGVGLLAPRPTPNLEDQISEFISPGDMVAHL
jgi:hypothetical protein